MYLVYKSVFPRDIIDEINDYIIDDQVYQDQYEQVLREVKWHRVLKELKDWAKRIKND